MANDGRMITGAPQSLESLYPDKFPIPSGDSLTLQNKDDRFIYVGAFASAADANADDAFVVTQYQFIRIKAAPGDDETFVWSPFGAAKISLV